MGATNYAAVTAALLAAVRDDPGLLVAADAGLPAHVSDEAIAPTMDQCPAVRVLPQSAQKDLSRIGVPNPSNETLTYLVTCWAFSAESSSDSGRQRSELLTLVLDAIERDRTLSGVVCGLQVTGITFRPIAANDNLFSTADINVRLLVQS